MVAGKDDEKKRKEMIEKITSSLQKKFEGKDKITEGEFYHEIFTAVQ